MACVQSRSGKGGSTDDEAPLFGERFECIACSDGFRQAVQIVGIIFQYCSIHVQTVHIECPGVKGRFTIEIIDGIWWISWVETNSHFGSFSSTFSKPGSGTRM